MPRPCRRRRSIRLQLKKPSAFRYIGKGKVTIVDLFDITTGKATYGQDVMLPGMKFAVIARPPVVQGKVASYDASATMKVPGVVKVVTIDGTPPPAAFAPLGGVAVIANNTWAALKGREALKIVWDDGPNAIVRFRLLQGDARGQRPQARASSSAMRVMRTRR